MKRGTVSSHSGISSSHHIFDALIRPPTALDFRSFFAELFFNNWSNNLHGDFPLGVRKACKPQSIATPHFGQ